MIEAIQAHTKHYGPHHARTLNCRSKLALLYRTAERLQKAVALQEEVVAEMRLHLG